MTWAGATQPLHNYVALKRYLVKRNDEHDSIYPRRRKIQLHQIRWPASKMNGAVYA
jgi:hypothetical protein